MCPKINPLVINFRFFGIAFSPLTSPNCSTNVRPLTLSYSWRMGSGSDKGHFRKKDSLGWVHLHCMHENEWIGINPFNSMSLQVFLHSYLNVTRREKRAASPLTKDWLRLMDRNQWLLLLWASRADCRRTRMRSRSGNKERGRRITTFAVNSVLKDG